MKKLTFILAISFIMFLGVALARSWADNEPACTNLQLAEKLAEKLGIQVASTAGQPGYFTDLANALAAKNITYFQNVAANGTVNFSNLAEVLYAVAGGTENLDINGKINYLINNGFLPFAQDTNSAVNLNQLAGIFNMPNFNSLVAEAYSETEGILSGDDDVPGVIAEDVASRT